MKATETTRTRSWFGGSCRLLAVGLLCATSYLVLLPLPLATAGGTEELAFDPVLSLRGDCTTSALDEVPDPGLCPGVAGVDHPTKALDVPCGTTVDSQGDIYVASPAVGNGSGTEGRIDVFDSHGAYLTEIKNEFQPCDLAVDSKGNLYAREINGNRAVLYRATSYPPSKGSTYEARSIVHEPHVFGCGALDNAQSVAVDPLNDHLYVSRECRITEYDSATNGSAPIVGNEDIGLGLGKGFGGIDVCAATGDVYAVGVPQGATAAEASQPASARVFVFDGSDGHLKAETNGSDVPGGFGYTFGSAALAVDQSNCGFYVGDITQKEVVDHFDAEAHYVAQLTHSMTDPGLPYYAGLAVDAPAPGQTGYQSPNQGEVYVAQGNNGKTSHLYAFKVGAAGPPEIAHQAVSGVSDTEAVLEADLNPTGLDTEYHFEYITAADYEAAGGHFGAGSMSAPVPSVGVAATTFFAPVAIAVSGLQPETAYRFRLVASNCAAAGAAAGNCETKGEGKAGSEGENGAFSTYGPRAGLPDSRAYELVSPPDTNGLIPTMAALGENASGNFDTLLATPDGLGVAFGAEGGSLPALGGGGFHDTYEATRGAAGWQSHFIGIDGTEAETPNAGGISPDHRYSFWRVENEGRGTLAKGNYLRLPDGNLQLTGIGSLGDDPTAIGRLITPDAGHVVFSTGEALGAKSVQLEPDAPPTGTPAVYDRTPSGPTRVVSLLPGNVTPPAGLPSQYQGASADGTAVAFKTGSTEATAPLYVRLDNTETQEVAAGGVTFGGVSRDGGQVVYLRLNSTEPQRPNPILPAAEDFPQGDIFAYDTTSKVTRAIGSGAKSLLVNVSADGSHVYFDSTKRLQGEGKAGGENLYVWDASSGLTRLVATLDTADVFGQPTPGVNSAVTDGLGLWVNDVVAPNKSGAVGPGADPSRSSIDGSILIFESRAKLGTYENDGRAEIYRYDENLPAGESISCLSCNPTGAVPSSDARLQSLPASLLETLPPVNSLALMANLSPDGGRAFFESRDPLVLDDVDGKVDVYQWEAPGIGSCTHKGGCVDLISGGHSARDDYLYAVSADGSDVFFETGDLLVAEDRDSTMSIYDARVGGGFPQRPPASKECEGEPCQPLAPAPAEPASSIDGSGNQSHPRLRHCPRGKHRVRHAGKSRCVKNKKLKKHKKHKKHAHTSPRNSK